MKHLQKFSLIILFAYIAFGSQAHASDYQKLSLQEQADLSRYLGWVWGDGRPGFDGSGILYKGANSRYKEVVSRLAEIRFDGRVNALGFPTGGDRKLVRAWEYWENSLPGGNPGDPQILRDAIKHPNFLAGIIEGEGQIFHSNPDKDYYIADQSYAPFHPNKLYDIANFGPERMVQLLKLLDETYGFKNPAISIGGVKFNYATDGAKAIQRLRTRYRELGEQNRNGNLQSGVSVKVYIKPQYLDQIRSYGYFFKNSGKYRTPAPDSQLRVIKTSFPDQNASVTGTLSFLNDEQAEVAEANNDGAGAEAPSGVRIQHSSGKYLSSGPGLTSSAGGANVVWKLVDLGNGYFRVESQSAPKKRNSLVAWDNARIGLAGAATRAFKAQWQIMSLNDGSSSFYLVNRFYGTYLRVSSSGTKLKHGVLGQRAQWRIN
jgi:hypothetical protein